MTYLSSHPPSSFISYTENSDLESTQAIIRSINGYIHSVISNPEEWISLKQKCITMLNIEEENTVLFEFSSEDSPLSSLYCGIENIEDSLQSECSEDFLSRLSNSEKMLQMPALLDLQGTNTLGFPNTFLVAFSYFYLSIVNFLHGDSFQTVLHFLQSVMVSPEIVTTGICESIFFTCGVYKSDEDIREIARTYKYRVTYYKVMSYGENHHQPPSECIEKLLQRPKKHRQETFEANGHSLGDKLELSETCEKLLKCQNIHSVGLQEDEFLTDASSLRRLELEEVSVFGQKGSITFEGRRRNLHMKKRGIGLETHSRRAQRIDLWENLQNFIKEVLGNADEKYVSEVTVIYQMLNGKKGVKYSILKDVILDQLLTAISSSKEKPVIKASMTALAKIISVNRKAIEEVKKKGLNLSHLANALKQNVQEAAILIYLINPSPKDIKSLELLPSLVDVIASTSYRNLPPRVLTPPAASLMIIQVLITAFDHATNTTHLATISSPSVLCGLLDVAKNGNSREFISLAGILLKCMEFDGVNRKYIYQKTRVAPFAGLMQSKNREEVFISLQFLHEVLKIPRSSAVKILEQIKKEGSFDIKDKLLQCVKQSKTEHKLFAADILLQLNVMDSSPDSKKYRNEATRALLDAVTDSENSKMQLLSTFILSNIGGTYSWTGESYTSAWLMKRGGLTSISHMNMIRNINWLDESLQDQGVDGWCCKMARRITEEGKPVFCGLQQGLKSKNKNVSKSCLITIAWLSIEISKGPNSLKQFACEILLDDISNFLHSGLELEVRLLACICIYNFSSGKGIHKLIGFSEGVRESLRRLSNVTWMADELHKATYYLFSKSDQRISCVHTQTIEMNQSGSGAVTALIYHNGFLFSGYSDGSIKVWNVNEKLDTLLWNVKEHKSAVTCLTLSESGDSVLSGSSDKTIRIWKIVKGKLECVEVIKIKESIKKLEAFNNMIFVITKGHKMKMLDSSRISQSIFKGKGVKSMVTAQGKIYIGCIDSSIQELVLANKREKEIRAPTKSWRINQNKPITSMVLFTDMLYTSSSHVEMSKIKDLRRNYEPEMSIKAEKGSNILAMSIVEDFIYLNRSSSANTLQVWLKRTQQKVGRLSAGSKITSLLTANDIVFCGTESGVIKGWIPL